MQPRKIKCPQCGLDTFYSTDNPFRPFCSDRCRLIDLGMWANEDYKIPEPITNADLMDLENEEEQPLKSDDLD